MARSYAIVGNATNTASSTLPLMNLTGTAAVRTKVYEILLGSDASPANNAGKLTFQRHTAAGTAGSAITPQALDAADPSSVTTAGLAVFSVGPTLTASAFVWSLALNQQASFRWVCAPGKELVIPAVASNGLSLMPLVTSSAYNVAFTVYFEE